VTDTPPEDATVGGVVADTLERRTGEGAGASLTTRVMRDLDSLDRAVYAAIAQTPTPTLDTAMRRVSDAANNSKIWVGAAAGLAAFGGDRGRRSAAVGLAAVAVTSVTVNLVGKRVFRRSRPDRVGVEVPESRYVRMPASASFPSGHSASAFAFVNAVAGEWPVLGLPLRALAGVVAYSRVHTGVHYPGDVVIGSLFGAAVGDTVIAISRHWRPPSCLRH
jgi:membrane-associated phospholipid phosphatase